MNVKSRNMRDELLNQKITHWYFVATQPGVSAEDKRSARRNYWKLVRTHRRVAERNGWTEARILRPITKDDLVA